MSNKKNSPESRTFFVAAIALSMATWQISFTLGAYDEIFYKDVMTIWVASVAALIASLIDSRATPKGKVYRNWWGGVLLLIPSVLILADVLGVSDNTAFIALLQWMLLLLSLPYVCFILMTVTVPDALELRSPRLILGLIGCVICVNTTSYLIGLHNGIFFDCGDFLRAGDVAPSNCWNPLK